MDSQVLKVIIVDNATGEKIETTVASTATIKEFSHSYKENYRCSSDFKLYVKQDDGNVDQENLHPHKTFAELGIENGQTIILHKIQEVESPVKFEIIKNLDTGKTTEGASDPTKLRVRISLRSGRGQPQVLEVDRSLKISEIKTLFKREAGIARDVTCDIFTKGSNMKIPDSQTLKEAFGLHYNDHPQEEIELEVDNERNVNCCRVSCNIF